MNHHQLLYKTVCGWRTVGPGGGSLEGQNGSDNSGILNLVHRLRGVARCTAFADIRVKGQGHEINDSVYFWSSTCIGFWGIIAEITIG